MTVKLVALKPHRYGTKQMQPGEHYEAKGQSDATLMKALGYAAEATEEDHQEQHQPLEYDESGELVFNRPVAKKSTARKAPAKKATRTYKRRDMQAE